MFRKMYQGGSSRKQEPKHAMHDAEDEPPRNALVRPCEWPLMTHKYRGSIIVLSISKSVKPNEEQKEMTSGFQQGILCKH